MPLLTELERDSVGWPFYKHGAPNGAFAQAGQYELSELGRRRLAEMRFPGGVCRFIRHQGINGRRQRFEFHDA